MDQSTVTEILSQLMSLGVTNLDSALDDYKTDLKNKTTVSGQVSLSENISKLVSNPKTISMAQGMFTCDTSAVDSGLNTLLGQVESGVFSNLPAGKLKTFVTQALNAQSPADVSTITTDLSSYITSLTADLDVFISVLQSLTNPTTLVTTLINLISGVLTGAQAKKVQLGLFYTALAAALVEKGTSLQECYIGKYSSQISTLQGDLTSAPNNMQKIIGSQIKEKVTAIQNLL